MKKIIGMILSILLLLSLAGCSSAEELEAAQSSLVTAQSNLAAAQAEILQLQTQVATLEEASGIRTVHALHATIDGQASVQINGETTLTAQAAPAEGQIVDHWELNGEVQTDATGDTFTFTASDNTTVEAVLRDEKKLTGINCEFRFLNADGSAEGDSFEEFVFEQPYQNPVTGEEIADGTISVQVSAVVPSGYEIDYWMVNGVEYHFTGSVAVFKVNGLNEATEYEVVLKEKVQIYYKVTCEDCRIDGKSTVYVLPGTTVTAVSSYGGNSGYFFLNGAQMNTGDNYRTTFTVNGDCHVRFYMVVN